MKNGEQSLWGRVSCWKWECNSRLRLHHCGRLPYLFKEKWREHLEVKQHVCNVGYKSVNSYSFLHLIREKPVVSVCKEDRFSVGLSSPKKATADNWWIWGNAVLSLWWDECADEQQHSEGCYCSSLRFGAPTFTAPPPLPLLLGASGLKQTGSQVRFRLDRTEVTLAACVMFTSDQHNTIIRDEREIKRQVSLLTGIKMVVFC